MKQFSKLMLLGMIVATLVAIVIPATAQDVGAGEGGTIIESNFGGDPATFNPLISSSTVDFDVHRWLYPDIIGNDDTTLQPAPGVSQAMAESWEYDETGTVLTITLRQDMYWSDGEQITADDWLWGVNAVRSGVTSSPRTSAFYKIDDGTVTEGSIHEITKIDDFTVQVRLGNVETDDEGNPVMNDDGSFALIPNCDAINDLNDIAVVPEHLYAEHFGEDFAEMDADPYYVPQSDSGFGTFGPFTDPFIEFGVQVSLLADQNYSDTVDGFVRPGEWLYQNVEDSTVEYERFLAGDFSYLEVSPDNQNALRGDERFQTIEYPSNGYTYMGYNLADPSNPQPGRDEEGNLIPQGLHPIFGDKNVRLAIAHAVDVRAMIGTRPEGDSPATGILEGNGYPIATNNHPGLSTTDDELAELGVEPYSFDPELAGQMLDEAGWTDEDGNGVRECHGCLYATEVDPNYEGTEFTFELLTNAGNNVREATGETIRAQLEEVGIVVNFQAIEFSTLVDELLSQQYDAIIIGWSMGLPFLPGGTLSGFFGIGNDRPGAGFNTNSYQNPEFDARVQQGDTLTGCNPDERDVLYAEAQKMIWEDQVYLWLFATNTMFAAQADIDGFDPIAYNPIWNIDAWSAGN